MRHMNGFKFETRPVDPRERHEKHVAHWIGVVALLIIIGLGLLTPLSIIFVLGLIVFVRMKIWYGDGRPPPRR